MKKILLALLTFAYFGAFAQIPNGSLAPNFTAMDIDGNTHELYDYLSQGYTVVLDVSATWCGPCWSYHTGNYNGTNGMGALEVLWEEHGVDNGGNVIVLMIEGDPTTNTDCLYGSTGCNSSTQGDWVTGTPYPIIDDASIADAFQIGYYPTIFTICPTGIVTETSQITAADHWAFIDTNECQQVSAMDATVMNYTGTTVTCSEAEIIVDLANIGLEPLTSVSFEVTGVDPMITYNWNGNLDQFEVETVNLGSSTVVGDVVISITSSDDNSSNNTLAAPIAASVESSTHIHFDILLDSYPGETGWQFLDDNGNVVLQAAAGSYSEVGALETVDFWVPSTGCYSLKVTDTYGDGMNGADTGGTLDGYFHAYGVDADGNAMDYILDYNADWWFTENFSAADVTSVVGVSELGQDLKGGIFPNPAEGAVNVRFSLSVGGMTRLELVDMLGQVVYSSPLGMLKSGQYTENVDLSSIAGGVYLLSIYSGGEVFSGRIEVK